MSTKANSVVINALIEAFPEIVSIKDTNAGLFCFVAYPDGLACGGPVEKINVNKLISAIDSVLESTEESQQ